MTNEFEFLKCGKMRNDKDEIREYLDFPECSVGLIIDKNNNILMVNQWRIASQSRIWEGVGGLVNKDENPIIAMTRELREETGISPNFIEKIEFVDRVYPQTGTSNAICNLFIIQLKENYIHKEQKLDEGEDVIYKWFTKEEVIKMYYSRDCVVPMKTKFLLNYINIEGGE